MTDDRKQELERLEKELLADVTEDDDLLADIPIELLDETPLSWEDGRNIPDEDLIFEDSNEFRSQQQAPENDGESMNNSKKTTAKSKKAKAAQKREDKWLIGLMIVASFLCVGIIGVLIYWMEAFLK